jgi:rod shape determining protein RodA
MRQSIYAFDWLLFLAILIISVFSLVVNYFLVPNLFYQQLFYIILGLGVFFVFSRLDFRIWERLGWLGFLGSIIFLLTPLIFGTVTRGAVRWIRIGSFTVQPSELVKPFLIAFFSSFFAGEEKIKFKKVLAGLLLLLIPAILIFIQPDLGSSLVLVISILGILLAAGLPLKFFLGMGGTILAFLPLAWKFLLKDYQKDRVLSFLDPHSDPLGRGYNLIQSTVTVGAGKFFGRGLGKGTQSGLQFLPERHTDFMFASFAENFGFFGVLIFLGVFAVLLWRILKIANKTDNNFAFLFGCGVFCLIFAQGFINIGMNLGLLPVTGIPLPLLSYGGSSFLATMIMLGILENICYNSRRYG